MANTRVQIEVEDWVRKHWLPQRFGQQFHRERVTLSSGGVFDFDAVSADGKIVVSISTSDAKTAGGKDGSGKLMKIRSDMLFLTMVKAEQRIVVLTEPGMLQALEKEKEGGRVPLSIAFYCAPIPTELMVRLQVARQTASKEVSPREEFEPLSQP